MRYDDVPGQLIRGLLNCFGNEQLPFAAVVLANVSQEASGSGTITLVGKNNELRKTDTITTVNKLGQFTQRTL